MASVTAIARLRRPWFAWLGAAPGGISRLDGPGWCMLIASRTSETLPPRPPCRTAAATAIPFCHRWAAWVAHCD